VALLSYLPLKSHGRLAPFVMYTVGVIKKLARADGLVGYHHEFAFWGGLFAAITCHRP
jgi:hypothetical protein